MSLKVFADFDGTVTTEDVGNLFFREFGGPVCDVLVRDYREGKLSAVECFRGEVAAMGRVPLAHVHSFLHARALTPGFSEFVAFCRERSLGLCVLSDGLDFYIEAILAHNGIRDVQFFAHALTVGPADAAGRAEFTIRFPYDDAECDRCACCKRNLMVNRAGESDIIAYIGDGFSDRCAAQYADIVFARGELQRYCQQENISYFLYETFHDVRARLEELLRKRRLRKRRRAEVRRRELFMREP
jgi:2-hydroxy-3-keto-5-methylthiopentenyl-1-phosphate phosphatase